MANRKNKDHHTEHIDINSIKPDVIEAEIKQEVAAIRSQLLAVKSIAEETLAQVDDAALPPGQLAESLGGVVDEFGCTVGEIAHQLHHLIHSNMALRMCRAHAKAEQRTQAATGGEVTHHVMSKMPPAAGTDPA